MCETPLERELLLQGLREAGRPARAMRGLRAYLDENPCTDPGILEPGVNQGVSNETEEGA